MEEFSEGKWLRGKFLPREYSIERRTPEYRPPRSSSVILVMMYFGVITHLRYAASSRSFSGCSSKKEARSSVELSGKSRISGLCTRASVRHNSDR